MTRTDEEHIRQIVIYFAFVWPETTMFSIYKNKEDLPKNIGHKNDSLIHLNIPFLNGITRERWYKMLDTLDYRKLASVILDKDNDCKVTLLPLPNMKRAADKYLDKGFSHRSGYLGQDREYYLYRLDTADQIISLHMGHEDQLRATCYKDDNIEALTGNYSHLDLLDMTRNIRYECEQKERALQAEKAAKEESQRSRDKIHQNNKRFGRYISNELHTQIVEGVFISIFMSSLILGIVLSNWFIGTVGCIGAFILYCILYYAVPNHDVRSGSYVKRETNMLGLPKGYLSGASKYGPKK